MSRSARLALLVRISNDLEIKLTPIPLFSRVSFNLFIPMVYTLVELDHLAGRVSSPRLIATSSLRQIHLLLLRRASRLVDHRGVRRVWLNLLILSIGLVPSSAAGTSVWCA